jgi:hypothetical protein
VMVDASREVTRYVLSLLGSFGRETEIRKWKIPWVGQTRYRRRNWNVTCSNLLELSSITISKFISSPC